MYDKHFGKKHRGIQPWVCFYCNFTSNDRSNFHRHLKTCYQLSLVPKEPTVLTDFEHSIEIFNNVEPHITIDKTNEPKIINVYTIIEEFKEAALNSILSISGFLDITDKRCFQIINVIKSLFDLATKNLNLLVENLGNNLNDNSKKLEEFLKTLKNPFLGMDTEFRFKAHLRKKELYKDPQKQAIGPSQFGEKTPKVTIMPIHWMLKKFFSLPNILEDMFAKAKSFENDRSGKILNYTMGRNWAKKKEQYKGKNVFPYNLYSDDLQVNNPLGSKYNKLTVVNLLFPLLQDWQLSRTDFIFPVMVFDSNLVKKYGNEFVYKHLIDILNSLATDGITIEINQKTFQVYLVLGLLTGDNLGVSSIIDFPSYSHTYFCRFCLMSQQETRTSYQLDRSRLRKVEEYDKQVSEKTFGMEKPSIFNKVKHFHVIENQYIDIMHDIQEGTLKYGIQNALGYFIDKGYLTIDQINNCLKRFSFGNIDNRNKISTIFAKKVKIPQPDGKIVTKTITTVKASAHEMRLLMKYFVLIFGHYIPENDKCWKFIKILEDITDLCFSQSFTNRMLQELNQKVEQCNKLYIELFDDNLKPKHHNEHHYVDVILASGPPVFLSCMRPESKHREIKVYTNVSQNRQNVSYSASKKLCLMFACFLRNFGNLTVYTTKKLNEISVDSFDMYENIFNTDIKLYSVTNLNFKGTDYRKGYFIFKDKKLYEIDEILLYDNKPYIKVFEHEIVEIDEHYNCYIVGDKTLISEIFYVGDCCLPFNLSTLCNGKTVFKCNRNI